MKRFRRWLLALTLGMVGTGCWTLYDWRDFAPLTGVGLTKHTSTYVGYFVPKHNGRHKMVLRIRGRDDGSPVVVKCRIRGMVAVVSRGVKREYDVDTYVDTLELPPVACNFRLMDFHAQAAENSNDLGVFRVNLDGDVDALVARQPE